MNDLAKAGSNLYMFHYEALIENSTEDITSGSESVDDRVKQLIGKIKGSGMKVGMAIKPKTIITSSILSLCALLDMILIMTVEPGFGGQAFMHDCLSKVNLRANNFSHLIKNNI